MNSDIPEHINKYLWDVNVGELSLEKHSKFIIERVLEYGDLDTIKWLENVYSKDIITNVLIKSKRISPKTGSLYALYFDIPRESLLCIRKPFTQKQNRF